MSEFGEVPKGIAEKGTGKASGVAGAGVDMVGSAAVETGTMLGTQVVKDAQAIFVDPSGNAEIYGTMPTVPSKPFEDEPLRPAVVQAPKTEAVPDNPLKNIIELKPAVSAPVEAPVIEGRVK